MGRPLPGRGAAPAGALPGRTSGSGALTVTAAHAFLLLPARAAEGGPEARRLSFKSHRRMHHKKAGAGGNQTGL